MRPGTGNNGFVLIYVLWLGVAVFAIAFAISAHGRGMLRAQARTGAAMIVHAEMESLLPIVRDKINTGLISSPYQVLVGHCVVSVSGANSLLNINGASEEEIIRLMTVLDMPQKEAEAAAAAILDWIDADDSVRRGGAEYLYYRNLPVPFDCPNRPIQNISELAMIRGIDRKSAEKLKMFVSLGGTGIDFRFAPVAVIYAIVGDKSLAREIVNYREEYGLDEDGLRTLMGTYRYEQLLPRLVSNAGGSHCLTLTGVADTYRNRIVEWITPGGKKQTEGDT